MPPRGLWYLNRLVVAPNLVVPTCELARVDDLVKDRPATKQHQDCLGMAQHLKQAWFAGQQAQSRSDRAPTRERMHPLTLDRKLRATQLTKGRRAMSVLCSRGYSMCNCCFGSMRCHAYVAKLSAPAPEDLHQNQSAPFHTSSS